MRRHHSGRLSVYLAALAALATVLLAVACASYGATPPGVVVDTGRRWVEVREDGSGLTVRHDTDKQTPRRCDRGDRWPECSRGPFAAGESR